MKHSAGTGSRYFPKGIWGAVLLPVTKSNQIDWGLLKQELQILCESPLHGIYSNGTAGESVAQYRCCDLKTRPNRVLDHMAE